MLNYLRLAAIGFAVVLSCVALYPVVLYLSIAIRDHQLLEHSGYIDKAGKFAFHRLRQVDRNYSHGLVYDHAYGQFLDRTGALAFKRSFQDAEDFSEGLAAAHERGKKWGFINTKGQFVINPLFDDVLSFSQGLAAASSGDRWGFIDSKGKWVIPPQFENANSFHEGLAAIVSNGKVGYINSDGKTVISPEYDVGWDFSDGLAEVINCQTAPLPNQHLYIDKLGNTAIDLNKILLKLGAHVVPEYASDKISLRHDFLTASRHQGVLVASRDHRDVRPANSPGYNFRAFSDGLLPIVVEKKWMYINKRGELAIPRSFDSASRFSEGLAVVSVDGEKTRCYSYIDKTGKFVFPQKFFATNGFSEGLAFVVDQQGNSGFIDTTGQKVISLGKTKGGTFHEGLALVGEEAIYP